MTAANRTVLVTGGAGFVGSHACKALAGAGYTPVCYDNLSNGNRHAVKWGPLETGDIQDANRLAEVIAKHRPGAVMHFAALAYVGESMQEPAKYYRNNVGGTLALLDAMRTQGVSSLVFSSSCATYGLPDRLPITETTPQCPINPYGATKLMAERMLADYGAAYGLRAIGLRYFNAAGSDPECEIGENHDPETHLVPLVLQAALGVRPEVTVFGNDYATADGTCVRDYVHVADLAAAHVLALQLLEQEARLEFVNLGNGEGTSVMKLIHVAEAITGRKIHVALGPRRLGDPPLLIADYAKARALLGWAPRYSEIETIVGHAWDWIRRTHNT